MLFIAFVVASNDISKLMLETSDAVASAASALIYAAVYVFVTSFEVGFRGILYACGRQKQVAVQTLALYLPVSAAMATWLMFLSPLEADGLWVSLSVGKLFYVCVMLLLYVRLDWREEVKKAVNFAVREGETINIVNRDAKYNEESLILSSIKTTGCESTSRSILRLAGDGNKNGAASKHDGGATMSNGLNTTGGEKSNQSMSLLTADDDAISFSWKWFIRRRLVVVCASLSVLLSGILFRFSWHPS